jgi:hypothetical protein
VIVASFGAKNRGFSISVILANPTMPPVRGGTTECIAVAAGFTPA